MKNSILMAILATLSAGVLAADEPMSLSQTAKAIRAGTVNVGKELSLGDEGRFHRIHADTLGIKCGGCHTRDAYPDNYLFLRSAEFPETVAGVKVKAVERAKCIGCHSEGSVATVFYNMKK